MDFKCNNMSTRERITLYSSECNLYEEKPWIIHTVELLPIFDVIFVLNKQSQHTCRPSTQIPSGKIESDVNVKLTELCRIIHVADRFDIVKCCLMPTEKSNEIDFETKNIGANVNIPFTLNPGAECDDFIGGIYSADCNIEINREIPKFHTNQYYVSQTDAEFPSVQNTDNVICYDKSLNNNDTTTDNLNNEVCNNYCTHNEQCFYTAAELYDLTDCDSTESIETIKAPDTCSVFCECSLVNNEFITVDKQHTTEYQVYDAQSSDDDCADVYSPTATFYIASSESDMSDDETPNYSYHDNRVCCLHNSVSDNREACDVGTKPANVMKYAVNQNDLELNCGLLSHLDKWQTVANGNLCLSGSTSVNSDSKHEETEYQYSLDDGVNYAVRDTLKPYICGPIGVVQNGPIYNKPDHSDFSATNCDNKRDQSEQDATILPYMLFTRSFESLQHNMNNSVLQSNNINTSHPAKSKCESLSGFIQSINTSSGAAQHTESMDSVRNTKCKHEDMTQYKKMEDKRKDKNSVSQLSISIKPINATGQSNVLPGETFAQFTLETPEGSQNVISPWTPPDVDETFTPTQKRLSNFMPESDMERLRKVSTGDLRDLTSLKDVANKLNLNHRRPSVVVWKEKNLPNTTSDATGGNYAKTSAETNCETGKEGLQNLDSKSSNHSKTKQDVPSHKVHKGHLQGQISRQRSFTPPTERRPNDFDRPAVRERSSSFKTPSTNNDLKDTLSPTRSLESLHESHNRRAEVSRTFLEVRVGSKSMLSSSGSLPSIREEKLDSPKDKLADHQRMQKVDESINWIKDELQAMRKLDCTLAKQLLRLREEIQRIRLQRCSEEQKSLIEDAIDREHEISVEKKCDVIDVSDLPPRLFSPELRQVGITRMNITTRRFSVF